MTLRSYYDAKPREEKQYLPNAPVLPRTDASPRTKTSGQHVCSMHNAYAPSKYPWLIARQKRRALARPQHFSPPPPAQVARAPIPISADPERQEKATGESHKISFCAPVPPVNQCQHNAPPLPLSEKASAVSFVSQPGKESRPPHEPGSKPGLQQSPVPCRPPSRLLHLSRSCAASDHPPESAGERGGCRE